jgi:hypothetical protein
MATAGFRVTYATLGADDEDLHAGFERGLDETRGRLGGRCLQQSLRGQSWTTITSASRESALADPRRAKTLKASASRPLGRG